MNYSGGGAATGNVSSLSSKGSSKQAANGRNQMSELVASSPSQRNWRGIGIALLVILVICSLIVTAVIFLTPGDSGPRVKGERFTYEDFLSGAFSARSFNGTWISDTEFVYKSKDDQIYLYDAQGKNATLLVSNVPFRTVDARIWHLSPDRRFLLLGYNVRKIFRHSTMALYKVYEISTELFENLGPNPQNEIELQYAGWGPVGNSLVFVYENNLFYQSNAFDGNVKQLTGNRLDSSVISGIPDWVYEEEILSSNNAIWFSKNGQLLCFASFNDSKVPEQRFEWYGNPNHLLLYPQPESVHYPKPGTPNPTVHLLVVNISEIGPEVIEEHVVIPPPSIYTETAEQEYYFTAVTWASDTNLSVIWMNRRQNLSVITICSPPDWICDEVHQEDMKTLGWVDWYDPPVFTPNGNQFFVRGVVNDGPHGLFRQVVTKSLEEQQPKHLTMRKWEVTKINSLNKETGWLYYTVAPEGKPGERHLYRIQADGTSSNMTGHCVSCSIGQGKECSFVAAHFSTEGKYFVLDCEGPELPDVPKQYLIESRTNEIVDVLETNDVLHGHLEGKALPKVETFRVPLVDGYEANVQLLLPPELIESEITQFPLVIEVYGGPGSQKVSEKFDIDWGTFLASNASFIYGRIDGRGSGFQGEHRKFQLFRNLGSVEVADQICVAKYLSDTLQFVDKQRIAIWGWSYGGFVTAQVMAKDVDVFRCGISVAPVTNWQFYDSVYTERYMGFPTAADNEEGYLRADVLRLADKFKTKKYFLIHGTADDNVHFQQSMLLSSALSHENVIFRTQVYPDENHALINVQNHLYLSMTDFLQDCFEFDKKEAVPEVSSKDDCDSE